jgi:hypothetical protein
MNQDSNYFTAVQRQLVELGQTPNMTADERDIVDDYEEQEFGVNACAEHLAKQRA